MTEPLLQAEGLEVSFAGRTVFHGLSLTLHAGEIVVLTGESGVGKSTLLRAIAGLTPFSGRLALQGRPQPQSGQQSPRPCALVTQHPNLWEHMTALDNVALVRRLHHHEPTAVARRQAQAIMARLQVDHLARRYPHRLSGGEQQRVALARGVASSAPLLLLDEITANIDPERRRIVADYLRSLAQAGKGIVFVSHDLPTARLLTDRPLVLTCNGLSTID